MGPTKKWLALQFYVWLSGPLIKRKLPLTSQAFNPGSSMGPTYENLNSSKIKAREFDMQSEPTMRSPLAWVHNLKKEKSRTLRIQMIRWAYSLPNPSMKSPFHSPTPGLCARLFLFYFLNVIDNFIKRKQHYIEKEKEIKTSMVQERCTPTHTKVTKQTPPKDYYSQVPTPCLAKAFVM